MFIVDLCKSAITTRTHRCQALKYAQQTNDANAEFSACCAIGELSSCVLLLLVQYILGHLQTTHYGLPLGILVSHTSTSQPREAAEMATVIGVKYVHLLASHRSVTLTRSCRNMWATICKHRHRPVQMNQNS
jgi:hypothetical protein